MVSANQGQCVLNLTQPPLTQDVKFVQTYVFSNDHIKLGRGKTFRRHKSGRTVMYTVVRYEYASCVDAQVTRKSLYIGAVA